MRTALSLLTLAGLTVAAAHAQERTLLAGGIESGGFGGPVVKFTEVSNEFSVLVGGRGGWIINHLFVIGAGGYGLANDIQLPSGVTNRDLEFGYGGLELEYINSSDNLVHFTVQTLIGAGGLEVNLLGFFETETVFVLEPGASVEVNIARFFRLGLGAGYRWVTDVDLPGVSAAALSAPYGMLTFKFGKF